MSVPEHVRYRNRPDILFHQGILIHISQAKISRLGLFHGPSRYKMYLSHLYVAISPLFNYINHYFLHLDIKLRHRSRNYDFLSKSMAWLL